MTSIPRPVRLEVNQRGAWKSICSFDAGDEAAADTVQMAAVNLQRVGGGKYRICTEDSLPLPLMYLDDPDNGWRPARGELS